MSRICARNVALLCFILATMLNVFGRIAVHAAVLPRIVTLKVAPMQDDVLTVPTPLPFVATYTLFFNSNGATKAPPTLSSTHTSSKSSFSTSSLAPPRSTSKTAPYSKKNPSSTRSSASHASTFVNAKKMASASSTSSSSQHSTVFPTVAPATPTSLAKQRPSVDAEVLPHNFVNKIETLVETYQGMTGRKARQLALILSNQTDIIANASRTDVILSDLAEAYPSTNATVEKSSAKQSPATLLSNTNTSASASAGISPLAQQYIVQSGRSSLVLYSNTPDYGPNEVRHDLHVIRAWAGDLDQLSTPCLLDETVAAILSASARYYPELSTRDAARVIMADIKAESDFDPDNVSGGRLDSGSSWGLMQVSPFASGELKLFQEHAAVQSNTYSWSHQCNVSTTPVTNGAGPLLDWETGKALDVNNLNNQDLFRPWVNIHVATWIQSNLARTSSQDPYSWQEIYSKSNRARNSSGKLTTPSWLAVDTALIGSGLPRSYLTALGSWVAGPAVDGYGSYTQPGDNVSKPYFNNIVQGLSVLFNSTVTTSWLSSLTLHAGLIDYH
ncbi:uncharacterized protein UMAG_01844 [Mycosarcoma maydis]|uniref:Transglycosylase SLT domain-containing protein n=1 Tax=Mycosarcoma maydis TaxID=5270 RepID=A0A0D1E4T0_MYCMD|nr:uncharacterized protein UMAG_01844 [Ustilago maydis 521]KIS70686.1 hypothetical protein UMAG_01844 [Ustilago maydis 521]|eukprot:XP_011387785.1 hypothetical protein UMAG_01844 [Ustilago maydis 521]